MLPALRRRASGHRHLLTGSAALVLTAAVQAVSGALFWLVAARVDTQTDVGHATALFTSVQFVAFVAGLGQPVAAARYAAGRTRDDHVLFAWGALATVVASTVVGLAYLILVSPRAVDELRDWHGALGPALFVFLSIGTALSLLLDVRLMTQRRWGLVLARATIVGDRPLPAAAPADRRRPGRPAADRRRPAHRGVRVRGHRLCSPSSPAIATTSGRCRPARGRWCATPASTGPPP